MESAAVAFLMLALCAAWGFSCWKLWSMWRKERDSVKVNVVNVGEFSQTLPADFFSQLVDAIRSHKKTSEVFSSWLKNEYVSLLEELRSARSHDEMLRAQGACSSTIKAYNVIETAIRHAKTK